MLASFRYCVIALIEGIVWGSTSTHLKKRWLTIVSAGARSSLRQSQSGCPPRHPLSMGLEADLRSLSRFLVPLMVLGLGIIDSVRRHILVSQTRQILRS